MTTYSINIASRMPTPAHAVAGWESRAYEHFARVHLGDIPEHRAHERFAIIAARFPFPDFEVEMTSTPNVIMTVVASNDERKAVALNQKARKAAAKETILKPGQLRGGRKALLTRSLNAAKLAKVPLKRVRQPNGKYALVAAKDK